MLRSRPSRHLSYCDQGRSVTYRRRGYCNLSHLSVERNITLGLTAGKGIALVVAKQLARESLAQVGLEDKIDAYPAQLSGGQQQRVAMARALAMQPRLMLFDEVTAALDPELIGEVIKVLEALASNGMTMILVTHEMRFAQSNADTVVFMHQGRIWEKGSPEQIFLSPATVELSDFIDAILPAHDKDTHSLGHVEPGAAM